MPLTQQQLNDVSALLSSLNVDLKAAEALTAILSGLITQSKTAAPLAQATGLSAAALTSHNTSSPSTAAPAVSSQTQQMTPIKAETPATIAQPAMQTPLAPADTATPPSTGLPSVLPQGTGPTQLPAGVPPMPGAVPSNDTVMSVSSESDAEVPDNDGVKHKVRRTKKTPLVKTFVFPRPPGRLNILELLTSPRRPGSSDLFGIR